MDLAIVTPQLRHYGGSEIYLLECLKRWQEQVEITLYTASLNRKLLKEFGISPAVRLVRLPSTANWRGRFKLLQETLILPRIWEQSIARHDVYFLYLFPTQMIRRHPSVWFAAEPLRMLYDLRHTSYGPDGAIQAHFYPKLDYDLVKGADLDLLLHVIEELDAPSCDRLVTNSHATGRYLQSVYGRKPDHVVYPGVSLRNGRQQTVASETILLVGRLWQHKRVHLVIEALALLPRGKLVIVGEGPEKPILRKLARDLGVADRVRFAGDVTQERLAKLYATCACCVYVAMREPFGMVPLEAAAAGRPVVVSRGGGYGEILDETSAMFVPPRPHQIAEAIQTLFDDPDRALRLGRAAQAAVAPYSWDRTAASLLEVLHESARNGNGSRKRTASVRLGAHYHVWYRAEEPREHWNENREFALVDDLPSTGPYASDDQAVIERHLAMALESGIDFFVVNWQVTFQGLNPTELAATRRLFQTVERSGVPVSLSIMLALDTEDPAIIRCAIETVRDEFVPSPAYHRFGRRALIWYYLNGPFLGYFFYHHEDLMRLTRGCHPVASGSLVYSKFLPRLLRDFFSGWSLHSPLQVGSAKSRRAIWTQGYRDFCEDGGAIRVFTVCPGYDDSRLVSAQRKDNSHRKVARHGLRTWRAMETSALSLDPAPDLVVVSSFNEFHENTHIEPSQRFGDAYLNATRTFKERLERSG